ncbi:MAG: type II toxin-antitoxin system HicA family toxin [Firmicutes bacterium]|nr:type II toxin-antitoxin system HicA family toxin [Bacillota bacterium]
MSRVRFTYREVVRLAEHFGLKREGTKWRGSGYRGRRAVVQIHYHRGGKTVPTGTLRRICEQFGFPDLETMRRYFDEHL